MNCSGTLEARLPGLASELLLTRILERKNVRLSKDHKAKVARIAGALPQREHSGWSRREGRTAQSPVELSPLWTSALP